MMRANGEAKSGGDKIDTASNLFKFVVFFFLAIILILFTDAFAISSSNKGEFKNGYVEKRSNNTVTVPKPSASEDGLELPSLLGKNDDNKNTAEESPRHTFHRRGQTMDSQEKPISDEVKADIIKKWGTWTWEDEKDRPTFDFYKQYPNRDVPWSEFPANSWQKDPEYISRFLKESQDLVTRAMEAILAEYGHGKDDRPEDSFEKRKSMFKVTFSDDLTFKDSNLPYDVGGNKGGVSTPRSWEGLKRRLLHSLMTEDTFNFAMGGHSSSAGHGNHFQQAYSAQVQLVLEPIFARLGVKHEARNFGNGGMGTIHNGLAAGSMYGPDVSFLLWDSGMTEKGDLAAQEIFARQAILGGVKVPLVWGLVGQVTQALHGSDVDIGFFGSGAAGLTKVESPELIKTLPYAKRYMGCSSEIYREFCHPYKYSGTCWIDRPDYTPSNTTLQKDKIGGRASWHPGHHTHRLQGRVMAFVILKALHEALITWSEAEGQVLPDEAWHVTSYYENTRSKIRAVEPQCKGMVDKGLGFFCKYPFKGRSEFTPRAYAPYTNIRTLMPPEMLTNINPAEESVYSPPDVFNSHLYPPDGEIDVVNILESGPEFKSVMAPSYLDFYDAATTVTASSIPPGQGVQLVTKTNDDQCDGLIDSFCDRGSKNNCLLSGHHDARNRLIFDSFSGWVKLNLPKVKYGYIVLAIETGHGANSVKRTEGWASVNNASVNNERRLDNPCQDLRFEYAIDGNITTLGNGEFNKLRHQVARVLNLATIFRDPDYTGGQEKDLELAFRIIGCGRANAFSITHIYWA